jgi:hypothetical protein
MAIARDLSTATTLPAGDVVLVTGGQIDATTLLSSAELFNSSTGNFSFTGSMKVSRSLHTATLLGNSNTSNVLVAGGQTSSDGNATATAELYDPNKGIFSSTGNMQMARYRHTATLLTTGTNAGKVLIVGGVGGNVNSGALSSAELYDPSTGIFTSTGSLQTARTGHTATILADGRVLVTGGAYANTKALATAELYDPDKGTFSAVTGIMTVERNAHTATLLTIGLNAGKVLLTGGGDITSNALNSTEIYDPSTSAFSPTADMITARNSHTATLLGDGTVLLVGGADSSGTPLAAVEFFDPTTGTFSSTGSLVTGRQGHAASLLKSGSVLVTGGNNAVGALATAELYK